MQSTTQQSKLKQKRVKLPQIPLLRSWRPPHYEKAYQACRAIPIVQKTDERNISRSLSTEKKVSTASALPKGSIVKEVSPKASNMSPGKSSKRPFIQRLETVKTPKTPKESRLPKVEKDNSPLTPPSTPESIRCLGSSTPSRLTTTSTSSLHSKKPCVTEPKRHKPSKVMKTTSTSGQATQDSAKPPKPVRVVTAEDMVHAYLTVLRERDPLHYLVNLAEEEKSVMDLSPDRLAELLKQACRKAKTGNVKSEDFWAGWEEGRCCQ